MEAVYLYVVFIALYVVIKKIWEGLKESFSNKWTVRFINDIAEDDLIFKLLINGIMNILIILARRFKILNSRKLP